MLGEAPSALAALVELLRSLDGTSQQASVPHPGPSPPSTVCFGTVPGFSNTSSCAASGPVLWLPLLPTMPLLPPTR